MTTIAITEMEPTYYGVQVEEASGVRTSLRIRVPDGFLDDLQLNGVDRADVAREAVAFLLDRIPATSVAAEIKIDDIPHDHPDFYDELRARLDVA